MAESRPEMADLAKLDIPGLLTRYARGVENFDRRLFELAEAQLDMAFLPDSGVGRWPVRVLLGHLADAELMQTARIRRAIAEDGPVFSVWDENAFVDAGLYRGPVDGTPRSALRVTPAVGGFVAVIHTLREWTAEALEALEPGDWSRRAMHPERGEQTVRSIVEITCWHLEHHAWFLNRKVERLLGPRAS
jgi:hypothetical protein